MDVDEGATAGVTQPSAIHIPDPGYTLKGNNVFPNILTKEQLNHLVRYLSPSKEKAGLLALTLQKNNLLDENVRISYSRKRILI